MSDHGLRAAIGAVESAFEGENVVRRLPAKHPGRRCWEALKELLRRGKMRVGGVEFGQMQLDVESLIFLERERAESRVSSRKLAHIQGMLRSAYSDVLLELSAYRSICSVGCHAELREDENLPDLWAETPGGKNYTVECKSVHVFTDNAIHKALRKANRQLRSALDQDSAADGVFVLKLTPDDGVLTPGEGERIVLLVASQVERMLRTGHFRAVRRVFISWDTFSRSESQAEPWRIIVSRHFAETWTRLGPVDLTSEQLFATLVSAFEPIEGEPPPQKVAIREHSMLRVDSGGQLNERLVIETTRSPDEVVWFDVGPQISTGLFAKNVSRDMRCFVVGDHDGTRLDVRLAVLIPLQLIDASCRTGSHMAEQQLKCICRKFGLRVAFGQIVTDWLSRTCIIVPASFDTFTVQFSEQLPESLRGQMINHKEWSEMCAFIVSRTSRVSDGGHSLMEIGLLFCIDIRRLGAAIRPIGRP